MDRARLRNVLVKFFSEGELQTLAFDLGIDYENLPGESKADKARELVEYFERRGVIHYLVGAIYLQRPNQFWQTCYAERARMNGVLDGPKVPEFARTNGDTEYYTYLRDTLAETWDEIKRMSCALTTVNARINRLTVGLAVVITALSFQIVVTLIYMLAKVI